MTRDNSATTQKVDRRLLLFGKNKNIFIGVAAALALLLLIIVAVNTPDQEQHRSESYKDISGAAGLNASVDYDCASSCDNKFDFNVYLYTQDGRQTNVVRPDKDGRVRLAMPEGEYVMLIGKRFGENKTFPQEPVTLKNGKELELKLRYKEVGP